MEIMVIWKSFLGISTIVLNASNLEHKDSTHFYFIWFENLNFQKKNLNRFLFNE